jgi:hypothetical protein
LKECDKYIHENSNFDVGENENENDLKEEKKKISVK